MVIGHETEKYRLLANGFVFHELEHDALCAALTGLSKVLLRLGLNTVVNQDHFALWSWCGELLLGGRSQLFSNAQHEIRSLYSASIHATLAHRQKPPVTREEFQERNRIRELQPRHAKQLLVDSGLVLAYLGFPLLEVILKRACATYIAFDGQVVTDFSVPGKQGKLKEYKANGR